ncbi:hypothetical protein GOV12_03220, partial [Candidatus Pacearchaeota archaeon]|nr:hypothetical protein [Candidatus Pacearchaeota archaeon]
KQPESKQEQKQPEPKQKIQEPKSPKPKQEQIKKDLPKTEINNNFQNPLAFQEEKPKEKIKPKSEYVQKIINFIHNKNLKIKEEKEYKNKEYNCILEMQTNLGPIAFLTQSKDKKTITDADLQKLLGIAQAIPIPALMIYPGGLSKKAIEYQQKYYSVLKTLKM